MEFKEEILKKCHYLQQQKSIDIVKVILKNIDIDFPNINLNFQMLLSMLML